MESNDAVLERHRARFEAHRQWLREQQASINDGHAPTPIQTNTVPSSARTHISGGPSSPPTARRNGANNTNENNANANANAPAYSQAQRSMRVEAAAEWVNEIAHQQSREPVSREPVRHDVFVAPAYNSSHPNTARSYATSAGGATGRSAGAHGNNGRYADPYLHDDGGVATGRTLSDNNSYTNGNNYEHHQRNHEAGDYYQQNNNNNGYAPTRDGVDDGQQSQYSAAHLMLMDGSPLHVYSRATQWAKRKQQKLLEMREAVENRELSECTFRPDRSRVRAASGAPSRYVADRDSYLLANNSNTSFGGEDNSHLIGADGSIVAGRALVGAGAAVSGWEEFMCRKLRAKQLEEEKKSRLRSDGSRWTGAPTVVEEFSLGVLPQQRKLQKVLRPPVPAPHIGTRSAMGASIIMPPQGGFSNKSFQTNYSVSIRPNNASMAASPSPPRAADVPATDGRPLPPKGLFSLRGSSTFVEGMSSGPVEANAEIFV